MEISLRDMDVEQSDRLGLAFPAGDFATYAALADAGFGRVRLGVSWERIQPSQTEWNFGGLDAQITILNALGFEPLLTFQSDASWATRPGDNRSLNDIPWAMSWWQGFVGKIAARYADFVDDYQVANEFAGINNESGGWGGTPDELVAYVDAAYDAVKAADPAATFVMGGVASFVSDIALVNLGRATFEPFQPLSPTTETRYTVEDARSAQMDALLQSRLLYPLENARYDQAAVHLYGDRTLDALRIDLIEDITGRSVISTESGAPTFDGTALPSETDFFTWSVMADLGALAAGAETVYWFQDYSDGTTFYNQLVPLRDDDGTPKPSFWAKKLLATYLVEDAVVAAPADGVFHVHSADEGDALIGFAAGLGEASTDIGVPLGDVWVLDDPVIGLLRRLETGEAPAPDDFVVADTGWLAAAAADMPVEPAGILTGSATLSFLRAVTGRTKIDMLRDGDLVDEFWYTGELTRPDATLDRLGLTVTSRGDGDTALGLGHGSIGVARAGGARDDTVQIDTGEALALVLDPTALPDDRPTLRIVADGVDAGETVRFDAYRGGTRVATKQLALTDDEILFDPGQDADRLEIGAGPDSAFSLNFMEVAWYAPLTA